MPDPFGHFWFDFGPYWTNSDIFGPFCLLEPVYMDPSIWINLNMFGPILTHLDQFGPLWTHLTHLDILRPNCPIWTH